MEKDQVFVVQELLIPVETVMLLVIPAGLEKPPETLEVLARIEGGVDQVAHPLPDQGLDYPENQVKDSD